MMAIMKAGLEEMDAAVETNQEEVNTTELEANPEEKEAMEYQAVHNEKAALENIGALGTGI
jgi:hypothetical protein